MAPFTQVVAHCKARVAVVSTGDAWIGGRLAFDTFISSLAAALVRAIYLDTFGIILAGVPAAPVDIDAARTTGSRNHAGDARITLFYVVGMLRIVVASPVGKTADTCTFEFAQRYGAIG